MLPKGIESHFLLNLETSISDEERTKALQELLRSKLISKFRAIKTEEDLLAELKKDRT